MGNALRFVVMKKYGDDTRPWTRLLFSNILKELPC